MNYRHGYHAGNFADVLKHTALCELLRLLTAKDKKLFVLDTHAGAGGYALDEGPARRTGEADTGIVRMVASHAPACRRLWHVIWRRSRLTTASSVPPGTPSGATRARPRLVRLALRPGDRFIACELHQAEALALRREFAGDRAVEVRQADGYKVLKALPAATAARPGADRSTLRDARRVRAPGCARSARACGASRPAATRALVSIKDEAAAAFATELAAFKPLTLELRLPAAEPGKLAACALAVINPPWQFRGEAMREACPGSPSASATGVTAAVSGPPANAPAPAPSV